MNIHKTTSLSISLLFISLNSFASPFHSTVVYQDTVSRDSLINISPLVSEQNPQSLGFAYYELNNARIKSNNAGASIFFTQYGQVPNNPVDPFYTYFYNGLRLGNRPLIVMDGIPYNASVNSIVNFNTYEFSNATIISDLAGASTLGVYGSNGAIIMDTKTGEGYSTPTFGLNSYSSYEWIDPYDNFAGRTNQVNFINQSTSLSYQQQFKKTDARVSLNHTGLFDDVSRNRYSLLANTGYQFNKKLSGRFFLQNAYSTIRSGQIRDDNFFSSHLRLKYSPVQHVNISSLFAFQSAGEKRQFANITADATKRIGETISISPFFALQYENLDANKMISYLAGTNINIGNIWFTNFTYRGDDPFNEDPESVYSVSSALVFSKFFVHDRSHFFTEGKLRANYGSSDINAIAPFPYLQSYTSYVPHKKNAIEAGMDLSFALDKILLSFTYFLDNRFPYYENSPVDYKHRTRGFEFVLKVLSLKKKDLEIYHALIAGNNNNQMLISENPYGLPLGSDVTPYPKNNISLLNQFKWKDVNFNFLLDSRTGGRYYDVSGYVDGSFVKLRELSLGYTSEKNFLFFRQAEFIIIGRNLWLISSSVPENDPERIFYNFTKSISLNLNFLF